MRVRLENGPPVEARVPYTTPPLTVDYVTTGADGATLYAYARPGRGAQAAPVTGLELDGRPLPQARLYGADLSAGVALGVAKLPAALPVGSYHVVGFTAADGRRVDAQFRVLRFWFPRSSFHVPPALCPQVHMNLRMSWDPGSAPEAEQYGIYTMSNLGMFGLHDRVAFVYGPDEPDAHDDRGGGYDRGLGATARGAERGGLAAAGGALRAPGGQLADDGRHHPAA